MIDRTVAKRYAEALVELALENQALNDVEHDLSVIVDLLDKEPELRRILEGNRLTPEKKIEFLQRVFSGRANPLTLKFLGLVVSKRRDEYLPLIYEEYVDRANELRGQVVVQVETGRPIPNEEVKALRAELERLMGKEVRLHLETNPDLIAGIRVRVGDLVIDGSLAGRLAALKRRLQVGNVEIMG